MKVLLSVGVLTFLAVVLANILGWLPGQLAMALAMAAGTLAMYAAKEIEASLPQCDTCGPMYAGQHHPDCPEQ